MSRKGVPPNDLTGTTYQENTRGQSNGGRSLKPEHMAWYREQLAIERGEHDEPTDED